MKTIGLDLGNATLGIAISDEIGFLARPVETFRFANQNFEEALKHVKDVALKENAKCIVLGMPKNMDGSVGEQGEISIAFAERLKEVVSIPVVLWDERLTSKLAHNMMTQQSLKRKKRKEAIDAMAATLILQSYLDHR